MALMNANIGKNTGHVNGDITGRGREPDRLYYRRMLMDILARIDRRLTVVGLSDDAASKQAKAPDAIRNMRRAVDSGDPNKGVSTRTLEKLAPVLKTTATWLFSGLGPEGVARVPVIGNVGANPEGHVLFATGQGTGLVADIPPGGTDKAVALRVVGHSMRGFVDDGGLIYFERQYTPPSEDMIGQVVIVETENEEVLVKRLLRGRNDKLWDLESIAGPLVKNVKLNWAAHITAIIPPHQAALAIHPEEMEQPSAGEAA
jgi:SOS-response transcriptional repressor LexA